MGLLSPRHIATTGCGWKSQADRGGFLPTVIYGVSEGLAGEGVHCAGLLEDTGAELLEWRSSPPAATPTTYLRLEIRRKEDQTNWTVKHNLCYWMSNKPLITFDFSNYNWLPNLPIIKESQIQIYVYLYPYLCIYASNPSSGVTHDLVHIQIIGA
jgi:hypothetical protein